MEEREAAPGDAKKDECAFPAIGEVRKPAVLSEEISDGVNAVPRIEEDVGFASMREMYFSA